MFNIHKLTTKLLFSFDIMQKILIFAIEIVFYQKTGKLTVYNKYDEEICFVCRSYAGKCRY